MKNVIVLGAGRSGTSMVTGTLRQSGYYMGEKIIPPQKSNPKGFFETFDVNWTNEEILQMVTKNKPRVLGRWFYKNRFGVGQRWLARIPLDTTLVAKAQTLSRIQFLTSHQPFCFKDPRFSYTLPIWRPYLQNTVFICVFRDPASTANSILKISKEKHLRNVSINYHQAIELWTLMYSHILKKHKEKGRWLFIHFNQVLEPSGLKKLEAITEATIDYSFPDPKLRHSFATTPIPDQTLDLYRQLCQLAEYRQ